MNVSHEFNEMKLAEALNKDVINKDYQRDFAIEIAILNAILIQIGEVGGHWYAVCRLGRQTTTMRYALNRLVTLFITSGCRQSVDQFAIDIGMEWYLSLWHFAFQVKHLSCKLFALPCKRFARTWVSGLISLSERLNSKLVIDWLVMWFVWYHVLIKLMTLFRYIHLISGETISNIRQAFGIGNVCISRHQMRLW